MVGGAQLALFDARAALEALVILLDQPAARVRFHHTHRRLEAFARPIRQQHPADRLDPLRRGDLLGLDHVERAGLQPNARTPRRPQHHRPRSHHQHRLTGRLAGTSPYIQSKSAQFPAFRHGREHRAILLRQRTRLAGAKDKVPAVLLAAKEGLVDVRLPIRQQGPLRPIRRRANLLRHRRPTF